MGTLEQKREPGKVSLQRANDSTLVVVLSGPWHLQSDMPPASLLIGELNSLPPKRSSFDSRPLTDWDSGLVSFLTQVGEFCRERGISQDREGLPAGLKRLVELAEAVPEKKSAGSEGRRPSLLQRIGDLYASETLDLRPAIQQRRSLAKSINSRAKEKKMKAKQSSGSQRRRNSVTCSLAALMLPILLSSGPAIAQDNDIFIYPSKGQSQDQQDKDRYECHRWAVQQTGFDPSKPQAATSGPATSQPGGPSQPHVLKGAARGAALGVVGGAIAGNAGKGAASRRCYGRICGRVPPSR